MKDFSYTSFDQMNMKEIFGEITESYGEMSAGVLNSFIRTSMELARLKSFSDYGRACLAAAEKIESHILYRADVLKPYIDELQEKSDTGHDCTSCTGKCHVQHRFTLTNALHQGREIRRVLGALFEAFAPEQYDVPDVNVKAQRLSLMQLERTLTEIMYVEELFLIPSIIQAQTMINAGN